MSARRRRRRLPRQLKTTREGKFLIALTLGIGFGAINSGNNLLYLVMGMLLSMIVVSGILSELSLRGVVVVRRYSSALHAGRECFLALEVENTKRRLRSFSIEVEELFEDGAPVEQRPGYALVLAPGEKRTIALRLRFSRRGVYDTTGLRVATRYPFSFFRKSRNVPTERELLVYPQLHEVTPPRLGTAAFGQVESDRRLGRSGEYHGLREHRSEDDPRDIHWKSSARRGRLMSREYQRQADRKLWILVQNAHPEDDDAADDAVEAGISEAASLASHYSGLGWAVGLKTLDGAVEPGTGPGQLTALLSHLARIPVYYGAEARSAGPLALPSSRKVEHLLVRHPTQRGLGGAAFEHVHECEVAVAV